MSSPSNGKFDTLRSKLTHPVCRKAKHKILKKQPDKMTAFSLRLLIVPCHIH